MNKFYFLHHNSFTLVTEEAGTSEMSVYFEEATRPHKPQGCVVHSQGCENPRTSPDRCGQARISLRSRVRVPCGLGACNRGLSINTTIFRNVGNYLPVNIASYPKKLESSTTTL